MNPPRLPATRSLFACIVTIIVFSFLPIFLLLEAESGSRSPINPNVEGPRKAIVQDIDQAQKRGQELCITPELVGDWVPVGSNVSVKHIVRRCCNAMMDYPPIHSCPEKNTGGKKDFYFQGQKDKLATIFMASCSGRCTNSKIYVDRFYWDSASLPEWNATIFCELLHDRKILFIGDSTMVEVAVTLMNSVHGLCQTQMAYAPSDTLIKESFGAMNRGEHWLDIVDNYTTNEKGHDERWIVVLSTGAHIHGLHNLKNVSDIVLRQIVELRQKRPNLQIVYKTQQPAGCTKEILLPWYDRASPINYSYNWELFFDYDQRTVRNLQKYQIPFLDMRMMYSRSDSHVSSQKADPYEDCVHFCHPGPLDVVGRLFLKLLAEKLRVSTCVSSLVP